MMHTPGSETASEKKGDSYSKSFGWFGGGTYDLVTRYYQDFVSVNIIYKHIKVLQTVFLL